MNVNNSIKRRMAREARISGTTQLIGIIATPIRHSISPKMHNAAFSKLGLDYAYLAFDIEQIGRASCRERV